MPAASWTNKRKPKVNRAVAAIRMVQQLHQNVVNYLMAVHQFQLSPSLGLIQSLFNSNFKKDEKENHPGHFSSGYYRWQYFCFQRTRKNSNANCSG
jgi:hypothetical protein